MALIGNRPACAVLVYLLASHAIADPAAAQEGVTPGIRRWEIMLSTGMGMSTGARGSLERSLDSDGFGDDVPCPPRLSSSLCSSTQIFPYPTSAKALRDSRAASIGYRLRPGMLLAVHMARGDLAMTDGYDATSTYELRTSTTLSTVALVPTLVLRDAFRLGAGPALATVSVETAAQLWSLSGVHAADRSSANTVGLLLHASAATRSSEVLGIEISVQHLIAGSVDAGPFRLTPESPTAILSFTPAAVPIGFTALRVALVVRPR